MTTEQEIQKRYQKALDKLEKVEVEVSMWEDLLKIVQREQKKLA